MPTFSLVSIGEARAKTATGKRAALLQEYVGYVQSVAPGEAGMLEVGEGETTQGIRRRLTAAAEMLGKKNLPTSLSNWEAGSFPGFVSRL